MKRTADKYELSKEATNFVFARMENFKPLVKEALEDYFYHKSKGALLSWMESNIYPYKKGDSS